MSSCLLLFCWILGGLAVPQSAAFERQADLPASQDTAQVDVRSFSSEALASYRRNPAYQYERPPPPWVRWWRELTEWFHTHFFELPEGVRTGTALQWLLYLFAAGGMAYAVVRLFQIDLRGIVQRTDPSTEQSLSMAEVEEELEGTDFESLLAEAVQQHAYRRAVRIHYLRVLNELDRRDLVRWRREKTNDDYVRELQEAELRVPFRRLTALFEYVWYGEQSVDASLYESIQMDFQTFRQRLS